MMRPDRLLFYTSSARGNNTVIEALFVHQNEPILFAAHLPSDDREFSAEIFSTNEEMAEAFIAEELLDACFCAGSMTPEKKTRTKEITRLMELCTVANSENRS